ncbi:hypothetical protein GQ457_05G003330 [Hibiscus cannabinus]
MRLKMKAKPNRELYPEKKTNPERKKNRTTYIPVSALNQLDSSTYPRLPFLLCLRLRLRLRQRPRLPCPCSVAPPTADLTTTEINPHRPPLSQSSNVQQQSRTGQS